MRIHHSTPGAIAMSSAAAIDAEYSSERRKLLQIFLLSSLATALSLSVAGCASSEMRKTPMPPNRMKGGGGRGGSAAASHR